MKRTITREIDWPSAYGERTRIVEFEAEIEESFLDRTGPEYPFAPEQDMIGYTVYDEHGMDITDMVDPDTIDKLEKQFWDELFGYTVKR